MGCLLMSVMQPLIPVQVLGSVNDTLGLIDDETEADAY